MQGRGTLQKCYDCRRFRKGTSKYRALHPEVLSLSVVREPHDLPRDGRHPSPASVTNQRLFQGAARNVMRYSLHMLFTSSPSRGGCTRMRRLPLINFEICRIFPDVESDVAPRMMIPTAVALIFHGAVHTAFCDTVRYRTLVLYGIRYATAQNRRIV